MGIVIICTTIAVLAIYTSYLTLKQVRQREIVEAELAAGEAEWIQAEPYAFLAARSADREVILSAAEKFVALIESSAAQGYPPALGTLMDSIEGSKELIEAAYNQNNSEAQWLLSRTYSSLGIGLIRSGQDREKGRSLAKEAEVLLKKSATQGYPPAVEVLSKTREKLNKLDIKFPYE